MYCVRITKETRWNQYHDINLPSAKLRPQPPAPPFDKERGGGTLQKFTQEVQALGFQIPMGNNFSVPCLEIMGNYL